MRPIFLFLCRDSCFDKFFCKKSYSLHLRGSTFFVKSLLSFYRSSFPMAISQMALLERLYFRAKMRNLLWEQQRSSRIKGNNFTRAESNARAIITFWYSSTVNTGGKLLPTSIALHSSILGFNGNVPVPDPGSSSIALTTRDTAFGPKAPFTKQTVN